MLEEVVRTKDSNRNKISPRYLHDERWDDLIRCLELDGYRLEDEYGKRKLVPVDPTIEASAPIEDDLTSEIRKSGLPGTEGILQQMEKSASEFRSATPNYNAALAAARVALETLAREIAKAKVAKQPGPFDESKWGSVITYLRETTFITLEEEKGLAGVYRFLSPGAHMPVGLSEAEMVRLGRSLAASMSYFLIKRYNVGP